MKKLIFMIVFALSFVFILTSCDKEDLKINGTYVGTYTTTNQSRDFSWSTTPTIVLKNGKYSYEGLTDSYYADGSGSYTIQNDKIIFELKNYDIPMEDVGIIDEYLLQGEYHYTFDGKKLTLSKTYPVAAETYHSVFDIEKNTAK